ncbi:MAG: hypothetical protein LAP21_26315, partial [Acidobacteriia bacterium]|nr:hypothetical protein [Terriglobia bacterium]
MDPVKLIAFAAFFGLFLLLARRLFSNETVYGATQLPPQPDAEAAFAPPMKKQPAAVGSDFPLPVQLPPRKLDADGNYDRPEIGNYYFKKLDLESGPEDPLCFCDEFYVEFVLPETATPMQAAVSWTTHYLVATPAGLQKLLETGNHHSLMWSGLTVIIPRWDIAALL